MTPEKIPYPARRTYLWAYPTEVHTYESARDLFARMRKQAPEHDNPARFKALTLALEALAHLSHHQGVEAFPGPKLHKLLCKSALAADWCPDLGEKQRAACAQPVEGSPGMYRCPKCREIKPVTEFLKTVSAAQRRLWGWNNPQAVRKTKAKTCRTCRDKAQQSAARKSDRALAKQARAAFEKAVKNGVLSTAVNDPGMLSKVFDYWQTVFKTATRSTQLARQKVASSTTIHTSTLAFYDVKVTLLTLAQERFDLAADAGQLAPYIVPAPHWTMFLTPEELTTIQTAHVTMTADRRDELVRGRTPSI
jgi:hypothetical protein